MVKNTISSKHFYETHGKSVRNTTRYSRHQTKIYEKQKFHKPTLDTTNSIISPTEKKNLTCKTIFIILIICFINLFIITSLILPSVLLYLMIPYLFQTPINQTNSTEPIYAKHCAGVSSWTNWVYYNTGGISMAINTSICNFNITPLYYVSITGNNLHNDLVGYGAVYSASQYGFTTYIRSYSAWTGAQMLNYSQIEKWNIDWVGIYY